MDVVVNKHLPSAVTVVIVDAGARPVDGELLEVGVAVAVELGIEVREDAALQQRIFGEVDASDNVPGLELTRAVSMPAYIALRRHTTRTITCSTSAK